MSVFKYFSYLSSCQKLEKSNEQFLRKNTKLVDGPTERCMDRQAER